MAFIRRGVAAFAAAGVILAGAPALGAEAQPSARSMELSRRLFSEMHMDQLMAAMMRQMGPMLEAQARKANPKLTDEQARAVTDAVAESMNDVMTKMQERMIPLYASTFTEQELSDIVAFYDTTSGKAVLAKMPVLMGKLGPTMSEMMPQIQTDITKRVCAKIDCTKLNAQGSAPKT
jgi:hypothetical protein